MAYPAFEIPLNLGEGGSGLDDSDRKGIVRIFRSLVADLTAAKTAFDNHKHRIDGTALSAATDITGVPVTGTATGTPTGGTAIAAIAIGTTVESGLDKELNG
jgi:hypothetical protein